MGFGDQSSETATFEVIARYDPYVLSRGEKDLPIRWRAAPLCVLAVLFVSAILAPPPVVSATVHPVKSELPASCGDDGAQCTEHITFSSGFEVQAYRNFPFAGSPQITHAMIVIHGTGRNAAHYFTNLMAAADKAGASDHTMILAPFFKTDQDKPSAKEARWTSAGWKVGDGAEKPAGLSSFSVMDDLVTTLANKTRFPNLTRITVMGHSAGAQFTQRYAAFGIAPSLVRGASVDFVVANPSSYVYFDQARPTKNGTEFAVPAARNCKYNEYKYGMSDRSGYVARLTPQQAFQQYASRRITYIQGGADTVQNGDMDEDCGAMLQGPNRLARGVNFYNRIRQLAPYAPQSRIVVPAVGHDHDELFEAPQVLPTLFGSATGSVGNVGAAG
ncbi:MAG TPA: hypothetical protein VGH89_01110 [Pseudonocardia sp.]